MNDMPGGQLPEEEDAVSNTPHSSGVTYTITVLSEWTGAAGEARRRVLFRRTEAGHSIELIAETSATNLLAVLYELLDAAVGTQRALFPRFAEELRRVRWLTRGGHPRRRGRVDDAPRPRAAPRGRRGR